MPTHEITHQTVRLRRGRHSSPRDGVCVMELASMLAGEPFTDRPRCVSPAIAGFLRSYNDLIDDGRRQDLYALASAVVGSRGTPEVECARVRRVIQWGREMRAARRRSLMPFPAREPAIATDADPDAAGVFAVRALGRRRPGTHAAALELVAELLSYGRAAAAVTVPDPGTPAPRRASAPGPEPAGRGGRPRPE